MPVAAETAAETAAAVEMPAVETAACADDSTSSEADVPAWDSLPQEGEVTWQMPPVGERPGRTIVVRTSSQSGATGARIWAVSHVLFRHLELSGVLQRPQCVLELGSGTGFLALLLAATGFKGHRHKVIATEQPVLVRALKYNVNRNQLRHAIECLPWDWAAPEPPSSIDWTAVTLCVGSDLVYYDESGEQERALARTLRVVLERCRPSSPLLLVCRMRASLHPRSDGARSTLTAEDTEPCAEQSTSKEQAVQRVPMWHFMHNVLPAMGLRAESVPFAPGATSDPALRLFQISLEPQPISEPPPPPPPDPPPPATTLLPRTTEQP